MKKEHTKHDRKDDFKHIGISDVSLMSFGDVYRTARYTGMKNLFDELREKDFDD